MIKSNMKIKCNINREAATISTLSSGKSDKYEYLTREEILLSYQSRIIVQAKFKYSAFYKSFEKTNKNN